MHRSCLSAIMIDCRSGDIESAASFWGAALGCALQPEGNGRYVRLMVPPDQPLVTVQKVEHESRVHLDIETDDIEAETRCLEALGASRVASFPTHCILEAPTGQRFCVVRPKRPDFEARASVWPGNPKASGS